MSNSTHQNSLLLPRYKQLMTQSSWKQLRKGMALGAVAGVLQGLALLTLLPLSVTLVTDGTWGGLGSTSWLIVLAVIGVLGTVIDFFGLRAGFNGALGFLDEMHEFLGDKIAALPLGWFRKDSPAKLSRMVTQEMLQLSEVAAHSMHAMFTNIASAVVVMIGSWFWDWRLGMVLTIAAPVIFIVLGLTRRLLNHGKTIDDPAEAEVATRIVEFAQCQGALRASDGSTTYAELEDALKGAEKAGRRAFWWESLALLINGITVRGTVVIVIAVTAGFAVSGSMTPVATIATMGMALRFSTMIEGIGSGIVSLEERRQMMNHVDEVMRSPALPQTGHVSDPSAPGAVELSNVSFGYETDQPVIKGVSAMIEPHTMCAIVGPSGSGKTTLLRLIARFYDTTGGVVRVGGEDVRDIPTENLMAQLAVVFQDSYLFNDTLAANVRIGNPSATDAELDRAAELAGVSEIVKRLPKGWETNVGEGGRSLSGGERQRVSIARALLKKAPVVLFDEATSALDAENEAGVVAAMERLRTDSTLIVVAHKLETIQAADQIIMLDEFGRVAQKGTHTELVETDGAYQGFWQQRHDAVGWSLV